jgi:hypothetical protein
MSDPKRRLCLQRTELIERYLRLTIYCSANARARASARRIARFKFWWTERKKKRVLESTLKTIAIEAAKAQKNGFEASTQVLNLGLFFLIAERDIQAVKIDALTHSDPWKRSLAARVILLTIHELKIEKVAGTKFRQALQDGKVPEELQDAVTEAMRTIRKAQSSAQRQFAALRNSTIAHRNTDAIRQYRDIVSIEGLDVVQVAAEFYKGTHLFLEVLPKVISYLGTWPALIAQLSAQSERRKNPEIIQNAVQII